MIDSTPTYEYNSVFAPMIRDYVDLRQSLGEKFAVQARVLRQFDRYCLSQKFQTTEVSHMTVDKWTSKQHGEKPMTRSNRISTLKGFVDYLVSCGHHVDWVPSPGYTSHEKYVPYIFTENEIKVILQTADNLPESSFGSRFHLIFPTMVRALYACGLRISEATTLRNRHVDFENGYLHIEHSKFDSDRRLPLSPSLLEALRDYGAANADHIGIDAEGYFFPTAYGEHYSKGWVYETFRKVLWQSGIPHRGKDYGPRLHDFRHTFAVHSLRKMILAGKDPYTALPILMTYLGHKDLRTTEHYLRLTAEIYPDLLKQAGVICDPVIPEVTVYED